MEATRPEIRKIAIVTGFVFLASLFAILLVVGFDIGDVFAALLKSGIAFTVATIFWIVYDRFLWCWRVFRLFDWLSPVPNLNGRWEGAVVRSTNDEPHKFVVEITQTYSTISFKTFTASSSGESICATILSQPASKTFDIRSVWKTTTNQPGTKKPETFHGSSHWQVSVEGKNQMTIDDRYFTDRNPATTGRFKVRWVSADRKNCFQTIESNTK